MTKRVTTQGCDSISGSKIEAQISRTTARDDASSTSRTVLLQSDNKNQDAAEVGFQGSNLSQYSLWKTKDKTSAGEHMDPSIETLRQIHSPPKEGSQ
jgi:hypothetical protein